LSLRGATRPSPVVVDALVALGLSGLACGLLLSVGGVWSHVGGTDLHGAFLPKYEAGAAALLGEGRLPLWNPAEYCGEPLLGVMQGAVLYPPVVLLFGVFSPWLALQLLYLFNWFVFAFGWTVYLRGHGVSRWAAGVGFLVTLQAFYRAPSGSGIDHPNFLGGLAWIPLMLLCWERASAGPVRPWLGAMALAVSMQWLSGYPDFSLDTAPLLAVLCLAYPGQRARRLALAVAGCLAGALLSLLQLLPVAEAIGESFRAVSADRIAELRELFALTSWKDLQHSVANLGAPALLLAAAGLWLPGRMRVVWALGFAYCLLAVNPPFDLLYRLPVYESIRMPLGWTHIAPLFLGLLAAAGSRRLASLPQRAARLCGIAFAAAVAAFCTWQAWDAPPSLHFRGPDLEQMARRAETLDTQLARRRDESGSRPRVLSEPELLAGSLLRHDLRSPIGYDPTMPPARINRLVLHAAGSDSRDGGLTRVDPGLHPELISLLGVGIVVAPRLQGAWPGRPVGDLQGGDRMYYAPPLARARIVHRAVPARDDDEAFALTVDRRRSHPREAVLLADAPLPPLAEPPRRGGESARIAVDEPERVVVEARLSAPGLLVLADNWYPGWQARVDGEPARIWRADYTFRAVALAAGEHRVEMVYRPASARWGALGSAAGLALVAWLCAPALRGRLPGRRSG